MFDWFRKSSTPLESLDLEGIAKLLQEGKVHNVVTMVGAGISTAAGIPDFRSPSSGIYDQLEKYHLPSPMAVFSVDYFMTNPQPFFEVAKTLYAPNARPTLSHYFVRLLNEKHVLRRHYTQNVDNLERLSGLPEDKLIEAHGTFNTGHCIRCKRQYSFDYMKDQIMSVTVPKCEMDTCGGVIKPDVVLFGDNLPSRFYRSLQSDFSACDLLIIMGTSLQVLPFCGLVHRVRSGVPRLYLNREYTQDSATDFMSMLMRFVVTGFRRNRLRWGDSGNRTDVFVKGDTDQSVLRLAELLGWKDELIALKTRTDLQLDQRMTDDS